MGDYSDGEFRVICSTTGEAQKLLNQWKHAYRLQILSVVPQPGTDNIVIVLHRSPKGAPNEYPN